MSSPPTCLFFSLSFHPFSGASPLWRREMEPIIYTHCTTCARKTTLSFLSPSLLLHDIRFEPIIFTCSSMHVLPLFLSIHPLYACFTSLYLPLSSSSPMSFFICRILCLAIIYTHPAALVHPSSFTSHLCISHLLIESPIICTILSIHPLSHTCTRSPSIQSDPHPQSPAIICLDTQECDRDVTNDKGRKAMLEMRCRFIKRIEFVWKIIIAHPGRHWPHILQQTGAFDEGPTSYSN